MTSVVNRLLLATALFLNSHALMADGPSPREIQKNISKYALAVEKILDYVLKNPLVTEALKQSNKAQASMAFNVDESSENPLIPIAFVDNAPKIQAFPGGGPRPQTIDTISQSSPLSPVSGGQLFINHRYKLDKPRKGEEPLRNAGFSLQASVPAGFGFDFVFRPWRALRIYGGPTWNSMAFGGQAGVTAMLPLHFPIWPTLTLEGGAAGQGDVNGLINMFAPSTHSDVPVLKHISYNYLTALLGVEFGAENRFVCGLSAGVSRIAAKAPGKDVAVSFSQQNDAANGDDQSTYFEVDDATITIYTVTGNFRLTAWF